MASLRDRAELEAARSEKLAALGQLVAGVAHEINNPNNFLTFNLPILKDYLDAVRPHVEAAAERDPELRLYGLSAREFFEDAAALIGNMQHGTQRIAGIVSQLRTYARHDDAAQWEEADVNGVVKDAVTLVGNQLRKMVGRFDVHLGEGLAKIRMNPGRIEQVVMNLLVNAGHAAQPVADGRVSVTTASENGCVVIAVEDNGPGVPAEIRERVFEPFFTTKQREQGTGMGLAISKRIVDEHGGTLELSSEPGRATRFIIRLPILPDKP
jgi:signal transduction histidine kinase